MVPVTPRAAGGMRRGNMGHLTRIANAVVQNLEGGPAQTPVSEVIRGEPCLGRTVACLPGRGRHRRGPGPRGPSCGASVCRISGPVSTRAGFQSSMSTLLCMPAQVLPGHHALPTAQRPLNSRGFGDLPSMSMGSQGGTLCSLRAGQVLSPVWLQPRPALPWPGRTSALSLGAAIRDPSRPRVLATACSSWSQTS